jgi:biotin transport system substrate-specific component
MQSSLSTRTNPFSTADDIRRTTAGKIVLPVAATAIVALSAHISFPLYFSPVPVTLQTLAVVLVGFLLGPSLGFASLALYLIEGASGLPVFAPQGPGGIAQLLGPTGGFLLSYPLAAFIAGSVARLPVAKKLRFPTALLAATAATALMLAVGVSWFSHLLHLSTTAAWQLACKPFLPGECIKIAVAAAAYTSINRNSTL